MSLTVFFALSFLVSIMSMASFLVGQIIEIYLRKKMLQTSVFVPPEPSKMTILKFDVYLKTELTKKIEIHSSDRIVVDLYLLIRKLRLLFVCNSLLFLIIGVCIKVVGKF